MQMVTPNAANFVWQTNFCLEGRGYSKFRKKTLFDIFQPFLVHFMAFLVPFLTYLINKHAPFLALLDEICWLSVKGMGGGVFARRELLPGKFWVLRLWPKIGKEYEQLVKWIICSYSDESFQPLGLLCLWQCLGFHTDILTDIFLQIYSYRYILTDIFLQIFL